MAEEQQQSHRGGFLSKLRGQAENLMSNIPAYGEMEHTLRQARVSANPRQSSHTLKVQLAVKGAKGVIIDHDAVARETKSYSKNILDLVRLEAPVPNHDVADIQDVGDRLAFLTYKAGELHAEHAKKLEEARIALKDIRNYEDTLKPQRDARANIESQLGKLRTTNKPDKHTQSRIEELQLELNKYTSPSPDSQLAAEEVKVLQLKREKISQSFNLQFDALQELGEKLAIIATHGKALLQDWDVSEKAGTTDYVDGARTASARTSVESALNGWKASSAHIPTPTLQTGGGIAGGAASFALGAQYNTNSSKNYAPSFAESHGAELASLHSVDDPAAAHKSALDSYYNAPSSPTAPSAGGQPTGHGAPATAPMPVPGASVSSPTAGHTVQSSSPFVQQLNNAPVTSLPGVTSSPNQGIITGDAASTGHRRSSSNSSHAALPDTSPALIPSDPASASLAPAASLPTVAETGAPIYGTGGPSSGVLRPPSSITSSNAATSTKSKEEEAREDTNRRFQEYSSSTSAGPSGISGHESIDYERAGDVGGGADLDRELSMRARQAGESLPAYTADGAPAPSPQK